MGRSYRIGSKRTNAASSTAANWEKNESTEDNNKSTNGSASTEYDITSSSQATPPRMGGGMDDIALFFEEIRASGHDDETVDNSSDNSVLLTQSSPTVQSPSIPRPMTSASGRKSKNSKKPKRKIKQSYALREIRLLQNSTHALIPRLPFQRVVREILHEQSRHMRLTNDALTAMHISCEEYIIYLFEDSYLATFHRGRVTLLPKDLKLAYMFRSRYDTIHQH